MANSRNGSTERGRTTKSSGRTVSERSRDSYSSSRSSSSTSRGSSKASSARSSKSAKSYSGSSSARNPKSASRAYNTREFSEVWAFIIIAFALILFLSNFGIIGKVGNFLSAIQFGTFGIVAFILPIVLALCILLLVINNNSGVARVKVLAIALLLIAFSAFFEMLAGRYENVEKLSAYYSFKELVKTGGGIIGGTLCKLLTSALGKVGAYIIIALLVIIAIILITEKSIIKAITNLGKRFFSSAKDDIYEYKEETQYRRAMREEDERNREDERRRRAESQKEYNEERRKEKYSTKRTGVDFSIEIPKDSPDEQSFDWNKDDDEIDNFPDDDFLNPFTASSKKTKTKKSASNLFRNNKYDENILEISPDEDSIPVTKYVDPSMESGRKSAKESASSKGSIFDDDYLNKYDDNKAADNFIDKTAESYDSQPETYDSKSENHFFDEPVKTESYEMSSDNDYYSSEMDPFAAADAAKQAKAKKQMPDDGRTKEEVAEEIEAQVEASNELTEEIEETYIFPPVDLLTKTKATERNNEKELNDTALKLQQTLSSFGVKVTVNNVSCGPAVTRYEITPEQGVKVSRIVSLADDIKLNLAAADIRIEAPIPGKAAVGIEVPNRENSGVGFRELVESKEFKESKSNLAVGIGKNIGGEVVVADIAKMPHVLIAGATGSGKSVCINTLIMSILYRANPSDVKLIMVDPKVVELSVYNGIPHLMIPVVTDPKKAAGALNWAVAEMDDRYKKFATAGVRDLKGYNERVEKVKDQIEGEDKPVKLPQIVIIIDELADLMMIAKNEVEDAIVRLAQLARACGIHLVIATQRPSVDVITGLIKANVPSRIAFAVSSGVDSRTILDMYGAEKLLGKGDMLFAPAGSPKPSRVQGAFVSDAEVSAVVDFLKENCSGQATSTVNIDSVLYTSPAMAESQAFGGDKDEYFAEAGRLLIEKGKGSIGMLQRMYKIGFNRAARIMDQLEEAGVVGPEEGTKPRKILLTMEEFEELLSGK